ncbi:MAG TPA: PHP domain-containing protein [Vicinamibacterales bacterium]|nr:PHP domain-containing protein [Vicinamibacterales bacterium]
MFIELHTSSAFSFLDGASLPEALVDRAAELGYPALALLDRDGVYGLPRFHLAAKRAGLKAIVGAELSVRASSFAPVGSGRDRAASREPRAGSHEPRLFSLPVLVASREGYRNLCRLVTRMKLAAPKGEGALTLDDLDGGVDGLVALAGRAAINAPRFGVGGLVDRLVGIFGAGNVCIEVQRHLHRDEESDNHALLDLASAFHLPIVATNGVRFATPADRPLYDVLTCIRHKTTLERAGRRLSVNAERYLKPPEAMARLFADMPAAVAGTRDLADRLEYTMADLGYRFPEYPVPPGETMASFLRKIAQAGARERYRPYHDRARRQIERELGLIEKLDLAGYFLIVWDIVNFCRQQDILVQGRGSAANSAVCYALGITAVDPVGMDLLFERFLSEERGEWPDIDLDLPSGDRRERVIQHVYGKYGQQGAAMTANVITYRGRSAAREVGKVLSMDAAQVDRLAKIMNHFEWIDPKETLDRNLRDAGIDAEHQTIRVFGELWQRIQDLPRHLGQHSGGMVVCQGRLDEVVPLENASMPGRVVVQWDKDDCADMGLIKIDLLGLGMMAVLQDALAMVNAVGAPAAGAEGESSSPEAPASGGGAPRAQRMSGGGAPRAQRMSGGGAPRAGKMMAVLQDAPAMVNQTAARGAQRAAHASADPAGGSARELDRTADAEPRAADHGQRAADLDLAHLPPDDPAVYRMLQEADTVGIFQVESRAQMATLPRLRPQRFYDIVVEVAIIRPGPIVGQMVHPYLKRRQGAEQVVYPHPSLEPILKRTLGVPLFQEQLLRMAMVAAGFSGGEAEELRRAFGFKRSEKRMQQIEGKLRAGMTRQGITGDAAEEIVRSITSFALYGFPESHAASFALLVYASAYLKAHYPAAFYTALLNNQPMGFYHPATLVKDAQRHGVRFAPIDVQTSDWECRVDPDGRVRLGLMYVTGLRREAGLSIAAARSSRPAARSPLLREQAGQDVRASDDPGRERRDGEQAPRCPKCGCDDRSMLEAMDAIGTFCNVCAHEWSGDGTAGFGAGAGNGTTPDGTHTPDIEGSRFASLEDLIARTGLRRDELATLAEIGALNAFGYDRRTALWQAEKAIRPAGPMFEADNLEPQDDGSGRHLLSWAAGPDPRGRALVHQSPLRPMTPPERLMADFAGTSLTIGPHPMSMRRAELALRGVLRAVDLPRGRHGRRVRVAGAVITRQRPGTAKGFVFLTLEDETGIANIIVQPDLYTDQRATIVGAPYLLVEGTLQIQEGVTSVKADRVVSLAGEGPEPHSHDFR